MGSGMVDLFGHPLGASFGQDSGGLEQSAAGAKKARGNGDASVHACVPSDETLGLAKALPPQVRLGTSSWSFAGWDGLVFGGDYPESALSKHGLRAYAQHPLLRTVSIDRAFYRALTAAQFASYATQLAQAEHDACSRGLQLAPFRCAVKAPSTVTDATVRGENGTGVQPNPLFLNPEFAWREALEPAARGLGQYLGALVFQISPMPGFLRKTLDRSLDSLGAMLLFLIQRQDEWKRLAPHAQLAVEVRDPEWVLAEAHGPTLAQVLKETQTSYCLGLHAKMPAINEQLPMLRALWPGPLIVRWNLHSKHGKYGYQNAKDSYEPFDKLVDEDLDTRDTLAKVIAATARAGHQVLVTINNKAEGSAPLSVDRLAQAVVRGP